MIIPGHHVRVLFFNPIMKKPCIFHENILAYLLPLFDQTFLTAKSMNHPRIIENIASNLDVFAKVLANKTEQEILWKPESSKWCLLEIVCHLYDEEREDFRTRVRYVLESPEKPLPMFDPLVWVVERKYMDRDYIEMVHEFLSERKSSIQWLKSLYNPSWKNAYNHPKLGPLTAVHFLTNWLAHDYLHIRQIQKVQFQHLASTSGNDLSYAGNL